MFMASRVLEVSSECPCTWLTTSLGAPPVSQSFQPKVSLTFMAMSQLVGYKPACGTAQQNHRHIMQLSQGEVTELQRAGC